MQRVVDAAPLILRAKIDALELLRIGAARVLTPTEVLQEVEQQEDVASQRVRLASEQWLQPCLERAPLPPVSEALGTGERALLMGLE